MQYNANQVINVNFVRMGKGRNLQGQPPRCWWLNSGKFELGITMAGICLIF